MTLAPVNQYGGLHFGQKDVAIEIAPDDPPVTWRLELNRSGGGNLQVEDVFLVLGYEWE